MQINSEKILFLDIETVPLVYQYGDLNLHTKEMWDKKWQFNKEQSPEQIYSKAGIYAEFAKVICVGVGFYNQNKFRVKTISGDSEKSVLENFSELAEKYFSSEENYLCAHNGKEFDFPFLCRRFLINSLPIPKILGLQGKKPWDVKQLDTLDMWKFGDYKNYTSLNLLAHVFEIPSPKENMDGSQVSKVYYEEKNLKKIEEYCMNDVITLARVYNRFNGKGNLSDGDIIFAI